MLQSVKELCRFRVQATDGKVGKAEDFYIEDGSWSVRYLLVNTGRFLLSNRVLVPPVYFGLADPKSRVLPVSLTKDQVLHCATSETEEPVSRRNERLVVSHYGGALYRRGGGPVGAVHGTVSSLALALAEADESTSPSAALDSGPALRSTQEVIGYQIEALDGPLGVAEDFLLDDDGWVIRYLLVNTKSWKPGRQVLIPPSWVQTVSWAESRIHVTVRREKLKAGQRFDPTSHVHQPKPRPKPLLWP